jgi:hypothetical protein
MRTIGTMACVLVLAFISLSCDTTQPLLLEEQAFELSLRAPGTIVRLMDVYDGFEDSDNDGVPDGETFLFCRWRIVIEDGVPVIATRGPTSVPWNFTIEITVIPAGATEGELVVSEDAVLESITNLTNYDQTRSIFGPVSPLSPIVIGNRTFKFTNGRILTEAREEVMASTSNPVSSLDPGTYGTKGEGLCSDFYPGPSGVDRASGTPYPFRIVLKKGDTVTVGARRGLAAPQGLGVQNPPAPGLSSDFTLDGLAVNVRGTTSSELGPGEGFVFSYTTR